MADLSDLVKSEALADSPHEPKIEQLPKPNILAKDAKEQKLELVKNEAENYSEAIVNKREQRPAKR